MLMRDAREWAINGYVDVRDMKTGGTPLHVAAAKGYIDVSNVNKLFNSLYDYRLFNKFSKLRIEMNEYTQNKISL